MTRKTVLVAATLGVVLLLSGVVAAANVYTIDADHGLTDADAIAEFEQTGSVSVEVATPHIGLTVAEQADACDVETAIYEDIRNDYFCIRHYAEQTQTLRIHVPAEYWHPYIRDDKQPIGDGPTASFQPTKNGSYTSVRTTIAGNTTVVYPIPEDVAASYSVISYLNERTQRVAGITLTSPGTQWVVINATQWADRPSVAIRGPPDRLMIEYDAAAGNATEWLSVPSSKLKPAPVHTMQREGANQTVYVVSEGEGPPRFRYRVRGKGLLSMGDAIAREIGQIQDKVQRMINGIIPEWV